MLRFCDFYVDASHSIRVEPVCSLLLQNAFVFMDGSPQRLTTLSLRRKQYVLKIQGICLSAHFSLLLKSSRRKNAPFLVNNPFLVLFGIVFDFRWAKIQDIAISHEQLVSL